MDKNQIKLDVKKIKKIISMQIKSANGIKSKLEVMKKAYKLYDEIYEKYGQEAYCKYVPEKCREKDVHDLLEEKRYISILNKHGEKMFNGYMTTIALSDMAYESGSKIKMALFWIKRKFKKSVMPFVMSFLVTGGVGLQYIADKDLKDEEREYASQIETYLDKVEEYGSEIRKLNLSDIQNIMIATSDMWEHIEGYNEPQIDLTVCPGLDLATEDGYGVCRNMADDIARKLNAINSRYNARVINVYIEDGSIEMADIDRKEETEPVSTEYNEIMEETNYYTVERSDDVGDREEYTADITDNLEETYFIAEPLEEKDEKEQSKIVQWLEDNKDEVTKFTGNHAVVMLDSIEDNVPLIVDPTNPSIGTVVNGKIVVFNSFGSEPFKLKYTPVSAIFYGTKKVLEVPENYIKGARFYTKSKWNYLKSKYGVEAQNEAIEQAKGLRKKSYMESLKVKRDEFIENFYDRLNKDIVERDVDDNDR